MKSFGVVFCVFCVDSGKLEEAKKAAGGMWIMGQPFDTKSGSKVYSKKVLVT